MIKFSIFILILYCSIMLHGGKLTKVTFYPQWYPQAQFAGFYYAKDTGIYAKHGLDVEIKFGPPQRSVIDALPNGKVDFVSDFLATGLALRSKGMKIVNICQLSQQAALGFAVHKKKSGITKLSELNGRRIAIFPSYFKMEPVSFLKVKKVKSTLIPVTSGIELFLWNGVEALTVMYYNEYNQLIESGINADELKLFWLKDHGYNIPEDGIYCTEKMLRENPERCRLFVLASLEGWRGAFQNPQKALKIVKKYMRPEGLPFSPCHQLWMLDTMKQLLMTKQGISARLTLESYNTTYDLLKKGGYVDKKPAFNKFYRPVIKDFKLQGSGK
jgi:NitT/TauT family transport system substrate-binding protein